MPQKTLITSMNHFLNLPDELCARIFQYLHPIKDRLPRLALVCSKWQKILAFTPSLWRRLHIRSGMNLMWYNAIIVRIFLTYGHFVEELSWTTGLKVYEDAFESLPLLTNLKHLKLPIVWNKSVVETVSGLENLEVIYINGGFELTDDDILLLARSCPKLKKVAVNSCWRISAKSVQEFLELCKNLENFKLKVNVGLPLQDYRSDTAMLQGEMLIRSLATSARAETISSLNVNFVSVEMNELWSVVTNLTRLRKLVVSNCETLHGIRLRSASLKSITLYNLWSVLFVSVCAPNLNKMRVENGLESSEHVEVFAANLNSFYIDGSGVVRTLTILSKTLLKFCICNCAAIDRRSLFRCLADNPSLKKLTIGDVGHEDICLDSVHFQSLKNLVLMEDFACRSLNVRCKSLRTLYLAEEAELPSLNRILLVADHLQQISLTSIPFLHNLTIQCQELENLEVNICNDNRLVLDSLVVQATRRIGVLRLFDCRIGAVIVSTPAVGSIVFYRCHVTDYALQMTLGSCCNLQHFSLEKSYGFDQVIIPESTTLNYLNLYGCKNTRKVIIDYHALRGINLSMCKDANLRIQGKRINLHPEHFPQETSIILPDRPLRWTHDAIPKTCIDIV
ncbi:F-box/LRR-repeat protein 15-like [Anneissia japonica]|uniref:F-box/LRR-repeat protein 15-like n=1 Tax=Anneissia japonica TaxID=1529436 RepID=UPI001425AE5F|nr:F-box/LRR-repeat protein 15-like [Anneissia japonica]XP_033102777.1 F-box/LRR-repeat protein 15-like [Anneissia japonica]